MPRTHDSGPVTPKMLGDAGEHYVAAHLMFAGKPTVNMPDGWTAYDLAVETGSGLLRISVKTRSESPGWKSSRWFTFDDRRDCDWIALIFCNAESAIRAWMIPYGVALEHANKPNPGRKVPHVREVSWAKLIGPLAKYENNWTMDG